MCVCVCRWLLSRLNMPLVCVCHECAVCVTHGTLMTDTHKWYIQARQQRHTHTLNIVMTPTCDTSNTHCVCDVSQVCVMSMLRVLALQYCSVVYISDLCVSVMSVQCVHTQHTHDRHTQVVYSGKTTANHAHT